VLHSVCVVDTRSKITTAQFDVASCERPDPAVERPPSTKVRSPSGSRVFGALGGASRLPPELLGTGRALPRSAPRVCARCRYPSTEGPRWIAYPMKIDRQHRRPATSRRTPTTSARARPTHDPVGARRGPPRWPVDLGAPRSATRERRSGKWRYGGKCAPASARDEQYGRITTHQMGDAPYNNGLETFVAPNCDYLFGEFPRWAPLGQLGTSEPPIGGR
jgi:hypothetical protein